MKNILIPTDFSENSWNAIEYAFNFFSKSSCNFYLLHIKSIDVLVDFENSYNPTQGINLETFTKPSNILMKETLKRIESLPQNSSYRFFTVIDNNYIIDSIRKQVKEKKIDFIVMGTKGASGLKKVVIGSNTGNVITKVKCATLVIPENAKYEIPKEIAFPTDFSFFSPTETLQPIADILDENNAAVRILNINKYGAQLNDDQLKNKEYLDDYFSSYVHSFYFLTNKHIEDAVQKFVDSKGINLITMLAKNLNYFQKILFHPTAPGISYYSDIPFLVLH